MLLDRGFQLRYVGFALGLSVLLSAALGFFLVSQMRENSRMVLLDSDLDPAFQQALAASDAQAVWVLIAMLAVFNMILALGTIVLTHRVVGPMFVFRGFLREIENGGYPSIRELRKGDEFAAFHLQLRTTVESLRARAAGDAQMGEQILGWLEAGDFERVRTEVSRWVEDRRPKIGTDGFVQDR